MATIEEENILSTPLHGIIIPSGLLLVGSIIVGFQADEYVYTAYGFLLTICLVVAKVYRGRSEKILNPNKFQEFEIIDKIPVSHNSNIYRFALPKKNDVLGLPTGQHITISATIDGKEITRSYTPISSDEDRGHFDLLIKHYPDGNISKHVNGLMAHQSIRVKGPKGKMIYTPNMSKHIGMICGGTGIAPMLQVLGTIVRNPSDVTQVTLLFANTTEEDILLKEDIDELAAKYPNFNVHYVLSRPPANWEGSSGYINEDLIKKYLPEPCPDTRIFICGPPSMVSAMKKATLAIGFEKARPVSQLEDQVFVF